MTIVCSSSQSFAPERFGFARQQRPFGVGKAKAVAAQLFFQQPIFCFQELDNEQLVLMHPARSIINKNDSNGGPELYRQSTAGVVPIVGSDGRTYIATAFAAGRLRCGNRIDDPPPIDQADAA